MPFVSKIGLQLSKLLPYLVIVIFTIIFLTYYRLILSDSSSDSSNGHAELSLQPPSAEDVAYSASNAPRYHSEHLYCDDIKDTHCSQTKMLIRELIDYLRFKSGQIDCSSLATSRDIDPRVAFVEKCVHMNKIRDYLVKERGLVVNPVHEGVAMESIVRAIAKYPHWGLRLLNSEYEEARDADQVTYVMSTVSSKSVGCRFRELLHFLYVRVIMLASMFGALLLAYLGYKTLRKRQIERDTAFYSLVSSVTNMVEKQFEMSQLDPARTKPFIAVAHIYDTLVDPSQRASQKKLWNKVIEMKIFPFCLSEHSLKGCHEANLAHAIL